MTNDARRNAPGQAHPARMAGTAVAGPAPDGPRGHGLVTCATTARENLAPPKPAGHSAIRAHAFPSPDLVAAAAGLFPKRDGWEGTPGARLGTTAHEGPRPRITIAPGVVAVSRPDLARRERTAERQQEAARKSADLAARFVNDEDDEDDEDGPAPTGREVTEWSRKSRARMTRTLAELDYGPLLAMHARGVALPMTTLTYPGDWETVARCGQDAKGHVRTFWKAFARAWGFEWAGIWKLEFQRRGAPHFHLWGPMPQGVAGAARRLAYEVALVEWEADGRQGRKPYYRASVGDGLPYREWLSEVWAAIVGHPDPEQRRRHVLAGTAVDMAEGGRMTDPRRLAIYFTKHGQYRAKEYQHEVPEAWQEAGKGPGRFWGYRGLEKATRGVELAPDDAVWVARLLRRYARAQRVTRQVTVRRTRLGVARQAHAEVIGLAGAQYVSAPGQTRYRTVRRPVVRLASGAGFLCVNDGPGVASGIARALEVVTTPQREAWRDRAAARWAQAAPARRIVETPAPQEAAPAPRRVTLEMRTPKMRRELARRREAWADVLEAQEAARRRAERGEAQPEQTRIDADELDEVRALEAAHEEFQARRRATMAARADEVSASLERLRAND